MPLSAYGVLLTTYYVLLVRTVEADELDGLLQAPHAALGALHRQLEEEVLLLRLRVGGVGVLGLG